MRLQVMVPMAEANEIRELRLAAVFDGDDVVAFEAITYAAARHSTDAVAARQSGVKVSRDPASDVGDGSNVRPAFDDDLGEGVPEEVLDRRE